MFLVNTIYKNIYIICQCDDLSKIVTMCFSYRIITMSTNSHPITSDTDTVPCFDFLTKQKQ